MFVQIAIGMRLDFFPINIGIVENIFNESKKEINLKNISSGIYFVKVESEQGVKVEKIAYQ